MSAEDLLQELLLLREHYGSLENIDISVWKDSELYKIDAVDTMTDGVDSHLHSIHLNIY